MDLLLTGRWMDPSEAARLGLVNEVWPDNAALMERVWHIARQLAAGPPLVFAAIKEVARAAETLSFSDTMNLIAKKQFPTVKALYESDDQLEGAKAFAEKRDPVWRGK